MNAFDVLLPPRCGVPALLLVLASLGCAKEARAYINCWANGSAAAYVNLPPAIHVPRDAAVGAILAGWSISPAVSYGCRATGERRDFGIFGISKLPNALTSVTITGAPPGGSGNATTYRVIESGIPGIGLAMAFDAKAGACPPGWKDMFAPDPDGAPEPWVGRQCNSLGDYGSRGRVAIAIVKTGMAGAGRVPAGIVAQASAVLEFVPDVFHAQRFNFGMTLVQIIPGTCETPDVPIPLGSHFSNEFGFVGATTAMVDFSIRLNNCPAGMKRIGYRIDPTTPVIDGAQSVVELSKVAGSATGVGVQLLDGSGSPFKLQNLATFNAYDKTKGGSYAIPMKARYYKTSATVTAGPANTAMTVTVSYD